ncbi:MAG: DUF4167 domain-containing protein [Sphingomicrobium sp.]
MINNRQGGRRRGRGGQRPQNVSGRPDGNRQDNRQRGNAAQLLEKYKSMARDSQLAGDRVQTEYYLQFADHYFRVLGESRARFEDQRPQRGDEEDDEGEDDQFEADGEQGSDDDRPERQDRQDRPERQDRQPRPDRADRPERDRPRRYARDDNGEDRTDRDERPQRTERPAPPRAERPPVNGREAPVLETLPFDVLPPAIGATDSDVEDAAPPRRRTRRPRPASDEGAPAA